MSSTARSHYRVTDQLFLCSSTSHRDCRWWSTCTSRAMTGSARSTSSEAYLPRRTGPLPRLADTEAIQELVRKVLANEPIPEHEKRLITPGVTMGGARPKALLAIDGESWIVKFADGDPVDTPLIEHASMTLLGAAKIRAAETMPIKLIDGHAIAIMRCERSRHRVTCRADRPSVPCRSAQEVLSSAARGDPSSHPGTAANGGAPAEPPAGPGPAGRRQSFPDRSMRS